MLHPVAALVIRPLSGESELGSGIQPILLMKDETSTNQQIIRKAFPKMTATMIEYPTQAHRVTERPDNAFSLMLEHEHQRTLTALDSARYSTERLTASTHKFSNSTERLTGLLAGFRLPTR